MLVKVSDATSDLTLAWHATGLKHYKQAIAGATHLPGKCMAQEGHSILMLAGVRHRDFSHKGNVSFGPVVLYEPQPAASMRSGGRRRSHSNFIMAANRMMVPVAMLERQSWPRASSSLQPAKSQTLHGQPFAAIQFPLLASPSLAKSASFDICVFVITSNSNLTLTCILLCGCMHGPGGKHTSPG